MSYRVLIVEGSATVQRVVGIAFASEDWPTQVATSIAEALELAAAQPPDLVVAGGNLADGDAYALGEALRGRPGSATLPLLLLTSPREPWQAERAAALDRVASVAKPFTGHALLHTARDLLAGAPAFASAPSRAPAAAATVSSSADSSADVEAPGAQRTAPSKVAPELKSRPAPAPAPASAGTTAPSAKASVRTVAASPPLPGGSLTTATGPTAQTAALPPLPDWEAAGQRPVPAAPDAVAHAVAQVLARLAPNLDAASLQAEVRAIVAREIVAILWEVVPKLAEAHLLPGGRATAARPTASRRSPSPLPPQ